MSQKVPVRRRRSVEAAEERREAMAWLHKLPEEQEQMMPTPGLLTHPSLIGTGLSGGLPQERVNGAISKRKKFIYFVLLSSLLLVTQKVRMNYRINHLHWLKKFDKVSYGFKLIKHKCEECEQLRCV